MVLSSDLITSIETMRSELNEIAEGRVDIIIGTQLVAKGHNFPRLNLVGVVDADLGLGNGDPRAAERTFQLLNQVIGRAGRDQGRGVGYLQTHQPEHPVMKALVACDREAFYASEIEARERTGYPPFGRLASLIISAGDRPTRGRLCAQAGRDRADRRADPGAGPRRSAAGGDQGPLSLPAAGEIAAQCRSVGIFARMARGRPEDQGQSQARGRRRSAELFVRRHPAVAIADALRDGMRKKACRHLRRQAFLGVQEVLRPLRDATLTELLDRAGVQAPSGDDLGGDPADAGAGQADRAGGAGGQVEHPAADERATVVDGDDDARPPWVTRSLVPNGSERWAAVMAFWLKRWPEAVLLPDSLP